MAQIKLRRDDRFDLAVFEISGDVNRGELRKFIESNFAEAIENDAFFSRAIFDFRSANLSALNKDYIKSSIKSMLKFTRPGIRAALIFANPSDASLGETISKAISKHGLGAEIRRFYNLYHAKDWLLY